MAHHIPVGTLMLLDSAWLHANKRAIPMAHRMLNNTETILAKTSSCSSKKATTTACIPKATKDISKTSFRSTKKKKKHLAHCRINRNHARFKLICWSTAKKARLTTHSDQVQFTAFILTLSKTRMAQQLKTLKRRECPASLPRETQVKKRVYNESEKE